MEVWSLCIVCHWACLPAFLFSSSTTCVFVCECQCAEVGTKIFFLMTKETHLVEVASNMLIYLLCTNYATSGINSNLP